MEAQGARTDPRIIEDADMETDGEDEDEDLEILDGDVLAYLGISDNNLTEMDYLNSVTKEEKKFVRKTKNTISNPGCVTSPARARFGRNLAILLAMPCVTN